MSLKLGKEREILAMAEALRIPVYPDPVESIIAFCYAKIEAWSPKWSTLTSIAELEAFVCRKLNLELEEIWSDEDLEVLIAKYVEQGEFVFATLWPPKWRHFGLSTILRGCFRRRRGVACGDSTV
jgi:hypothetical protein